MINARSEICNFISTNKKVWTDILKVTYVLIQKDRIGKFGISERDNVPGIWGHSYIKTYYNWTNAEVSKRVHLEGGIATSYFVLKALVGFHNKLNSKLPSALVNDLIAFLNARNARGEIGIRNVSTKGDFKIDGNLRHSCLGILILAELLNSSVKNGELHRLMHEISAYVLSPKTQGQLLDEWINESWPTGSIASYIKARDFLINTSYGREWSRNEGKLWGEVRKIILEALSDLSGARLLSLQKKSSAAEGNKRVGGHMPFWPPIKGLPKLRLHSTLGCLNLIGNDLAQTRMGAERIKKIVKALGNNFMQEDELPRFEKDSSPSFSAACAMLSIVLGNWYEPQPDDLSIIKALLSFIQSNWNKHDVYHDFWSEFAANLLNMNEFHIALGDEMQKVFVSGEELCTALDYPAKKLRISAQPLDQELLGTIQKIVPIALENSDLFDYKLTPTHL